MEPTSTSGSIGSANVGSATLADVMNGWSIPEQFRAQAVQNVNLLVIAAAEGSYSAQAFVFDTQTGGLLSTLIIVVKRLDSPTDPNAPVAVSYVTINSNAAVKQQYTHYTTRNCHKCSRCFWTRACCCHTVNNQSPRGNTPEEVDVIKKKMTVDQYIWFTQQSLKTVEGRGLSQSNAQNPTVTLNDVIEKFLSNNVVKAEILASYKDPVLSALQSNIGSLKLSSQSLKLIKIAQDNVFTVLSTLAKDYSKISLPMHDFYSNFKQDDFPSRISLPHLLIIIENKLL